RELIDVLRVQGAAEERHVHVVPLRARDGLIDVGDGLLDGPPAPHAGDVGTGPAPATRRGARYFASSAGRSAPASWDSRFCGNRNDGTLDQSPSMMAVPLPPSLASAS